MRHRKEYTARVNRVVDHIERHLDVELSLTELASIAHFSPFHFHRVFRAMVGETLQRFVQRLRLERAATWLVHDPERSITSIALDSGFASSATFARAFRAEFGMSASACRDGSQHRNLGKLVGNSGKAEAGAGPYGVSQMENTTPKNRAVDMQVEVRDLEPTRVAYVRHTGPYAGDENLFETLFGRLSKWAGPRGLLGPSSQFLCVYHDNPQVTDEAKRRISVSVTVPESTEVEGEIGAMVLDGGRYAIAKIRIDADQYADAWDQLLSEWMPDSGYQPDDRLSFERFLNDPASDPEQKHELEICFPVRPL
ncbi:MAG: AraC family transcriptional regulator [Nannocystales bacterium]